MMLSALLSVLIICLVVPRKTFAQVPQTLSYQGFLVDNNGQPLDGETLITFKFYDALEGGNLLATRGPVAVNPYKGLFSKILGDGGTNNAPLDFALGDKEIFLEIIIGSDPDGAPLVPRAQITATPYAFVAHTVKNVDAANINSGTLPIERIADGAISNAKLATGIDAGKLTGTLSNANISLESSSASKLASGTTEQRPSTPVEGQIRYNTEEKVMEYFNGTNWYFVTPKVAIVKDVHPAGNPGGGDALADTWNLRKLNTIEGDASFVSLNNSQITIPAGEYWIDADAPAFWVAEHKLRLTRVSGAEAHLAHGTSEYIPIANVNHRAFLHAHIVTTEALTFELQHFTQLGFAAEGLGVSGGTGANNVADTYARVKITRLR